MEQVEAAVGEDDASPGGPPGGALLAQKVE
jgi:hypothetical protein